MPDGQMNSMGAQAFDEMKTKTPIEKNPALNDYVKCITAPLTAAAKDQLPVENWEVVVFKDDTANAFALPGGKIGVHTGLLKVAKSDGQLAAVIGHEVGHVIARHGNERVSQSLGTQLGLAGVSAALGADNPNRGVLMGALGLGAQFGVLLPYGRTQESEADLIGLDLMSRAGFPPAESVELWKNMKEASGGKAPPQFMSTHPSSDTRIKDLEAHLPEAMPKYDAARKAGQLPNCPRPTGV